MDILNVLFVIEFGVFCVAVLAGLLQSWVGRDDLSLPMLAECPTPKSVTPPADLLASNLGEWNRWRELNPEIPVMLRGLTFRKATLAGANLSNAAIVDCSFEGAILDGAQFRDSQILRVNLSGCRLVAAVFSGARLVDSSFENALLADSVFYSTVFDRCSLSRANGLDGCCYVGACHCDAATVHASWPLAREFQEGCGISAELEVQRLCDDAFAIRTRRDLPRDRPADALDNPGHESVSQVGRMIRLKRMQCGLDRETLAEACDVPCSDLREIELGRKEAALRLLARLSAVMECEPADFLRQPTPSTY